MQAKRASTQEVQTKKEGKEGEAKPSMEVLLSQTKGKGMPLPDDVREEMEAHFKADFSNVRIHTDAAAIEMNQMVKAYAFTHGYDIYFNKGQFNPYSPNGKELLAHELTHVVQQKGGQF